MVTDAPLTDRLGSGFRAQKGEYQYPGHKRGVVTGGSETHSPAVSMLFSEDDYRLVTEAFRLPKVTTLYLTNRVSRLRGQFQIYHMSLDNERPILGGQDNP